MLQVTETELQSRLSFDNPWWLEGAVPERFRLWPRRAYLEGFYQLFARAPVRRAVVLLGPRRVGKTVLVHQAVQRLIEEGVTPTRILYVSVDTPVYSGLPLERLLSLFQGMHEHGRGAQLFVIFDEIQYLPRWEVHLKSLVDSYPDIRFVGSGSAAAALRMKSIESGAGRFTDFLLPPLTFVEFLEFTGRRTEDQQTLPLPDELDSLNRSFIDYLNFGGFPEAVMDERVRQNMDRYIAGDIIDKVLLRDLPGLYGISDTAELNRLFTALAYNTANEISLEELSQASGVAKNTLRKYLEYLEAAFLILRLGRIDFSAKRFRRATHFKVYLINPSIRAALFGSVGADDEAMGRMAENAWISQVVQTRLVRGLHYARWKEGEVDFVQLDERTLRPNLAVEVKWSDRALQRPHRELAGLIDFAKEHRLATVTIGTRSAFGRVGSEPALNFVPIARLCARIGAEVVHAAFTEGRHPRTLMRLSEMHEGLH